MYHHHPEFQRQRYQERMAEMRKEYRQAPSQCESQPNMSMSSARHTRWSMWWERRRRSTSRAGSYGA
jgi:hypothetical protein